MPNQRFCLTLDLHDDPNLIAAYDTHHRAVWPEVLASIESAGITRLEIYRYHTRLCMWIEANDDFSFEKKQAMDAANPRVQAWEALMWTYQKALPGALPGQKWLLMDKIFG
jgi:L-rhamnose mutarotase